MVVGAVMSEPVSALISLLRGKIQGNFANLPTLEAFNAQKLTQFQVLTLEIPYSN